jgi:hypothetical protein
LARLMEVCALAAPALSPLTAMAAQVAPTANEVRSRRRRRLGGEEMLGVVVLGVLVLGVLVLGTRSLSMGTREAPRLGCRLRHHEPVGWPRLRLAVHDGLYGARPSQAFRLARRSGPTVAGQRRAWTGFPSAGRASGT